jgi:ParB-like chromosome segregation protein Spo0J
LARSKDSSTAPGSLTVKIADCEPNPWNPNKMDAFVYAKVLDSLQEYGPIDPLTVRPHPVMLATGRGPAWQILDGEHRWSGAKDLGMEEFPAFSTGEISDQKAMKITITLNELRGQYDPRDMGELLGKLLEAEDPIQLAKSLPFTDVALQGMVGLSDLDLTPDLEVAVSAGEALKQERAQWVERVFRVTTEANGVVQAALDKAKDGEPMNDAQALELVCADFLAGN